MLDAWNQFFEQLGLWSGNLCPAREEDVCGGIGVIAAMKRWVTVTHEDSISKDLRRCSKQAMTFKSHDNNVLLGSSVLNKDTSAFFHSVIWEKVDNTEPFKRRCRGEDSKGSREPWYGITIPCFAGPAVRCLKAAFWQPSKTLWR